MSDEGLKELYIEELKDIYNAENQLVRALPKLDKGRCLGRIASGFRGAPGTDQRTHCANRTNIRDAR
jgi:hypothetical protein